MKLEKIFFKNIGFLRILFLKNVKKTFSNKIIILNALCKNLKNFLKLYYDNLYFFNTFCMILIAI